MSPNLRGLKQAEEAANARSLAVALSDNTIHRAFTETVRKHGDRPALAYKVAGEYERLNYAALGERVRAFRRGLAALGVRRGDRVAILSYNRAEWAVTDLAVQGLGAVTVPIYHTLPASQVEFYLNDSRATTLVVEDDRQLAKVTGLAVRPPHLERIIIVRGPAPVGTTLFSDVERMDRAPGCSDEELDTLEAAVGPDEIATFIYTSGTTGAPKAAMLSHRALLYTSQAAQSLVRIDENDVFLSFLPLCHVVERVGGHYLPLTIGAQIVYSEGPFAVGAEIAAVRPTIFLCVPRLYEAVQERVQEAVLKMPPMRRRLVEWALACGKQAARRRMEPRGPHSRGLVLSLADRLVLRKLRDKATGGRVRFLVSGGAPLNTETALFFESMGVCMLEGYGLTEFPVISLNLPGLQCLGTVGQPLPGIEVALTPEEEIIARGPSLMKGYFEREQATSEVIEPDGWFHTGDIGQITREGFIRITDRIKDIIVLANGKNVAPQPIEAVLKQSPWISEAVLIGDGQSVIVALVIPAFERLKVWAKDQGLGVDDMAALVKLPAVRKLYKDEIDSRSRDLADFERVKRFTLLDHALTIENDELTPTLKVKRRVIAQRYGEIIREMLG